MRELAGQLLACEANQVRARNHSNVGQYKYHEVEVWSGIWAGGIWLIGWVL